VGGDQAQEGDRRRPSRQALHQARARDHRRGEGGRRRRRGQPGARAGRAEGQGRGEGGDAAALEAVTYEGYGAGGIAILVEATTDNRNRTGSEVRHAFTKHNGNLGEPGSVAYLFDKKGVVVVDGERYSEDDLMVAIDAGAEDIGTDDDVFEVTCEPSDLSAVRAALDEAGIAVESAEVAQLPKTRVELDEDGAVKVLRLIEALEDLDDVDAVHANFDVDAEVLERVAG
jgi:YebC/PmpR family DNA-binding regulatory protein